MRHAGAWIVAGAVLAVLPGTALADKLAPSAIQATFFDGKTFTATTPSGVKFKMTFAPDGRMTREPLAKEGAKGEGAWTLAGDGFCTTWKGAKANCFTVVPSGANAWSVMKGSVPVAVWSK